MNVERIWTLAALSAALILSSATTLRAQVAPSEAPTTAVLATLTLEPSADAATLAKALPGEVRATVQLYLDGKISQWYSRGDGKGVIFIMNCGSVDEARALTDALPLAKAHLATFAFTALRPLGPLRVLLTGTGPLPPSDPRP
jgi:hypothetical protein